MGKIEKGGVRKYENNDFSMVNLATGYVFTKIVENGGELLRISEKFC